jgi:Ca-activated chloride channel homolog
MLATAKDAGAAQPDGDTSQLIEWPLTRAQILPDGHAASERFRFAAAVAGFRQLLRGARYTGDFGYD